MKSAAEIAEALGGEPSGAGWKARCPAHDDGTASLSITELNGKTLWKCHAGCDQAKVTAGLQAKGIIGKGGRPKGGANAKIVKTYDYLDATGKLVGQVCRMEPKSFRQRRPDPSAPGKWLWQMGGLQLPLYRLPELQKPNAIVVVEGEKDVDNLWALGVPATTSPGGAGKWRGIHTEALAGKRIAVIADNDPPEKQFAGQKHAQQIAVALHAAGIPVRKMLCPDGHKDVSDWIKAGATREQIVAAIKAAPEYVGSAGLDDAPSASTPPVEGDADSPASTAPSGTPRDSTRWPFRVLGYDHDNYYFLPDGKQQIVVLTPGQMAGASMLQLAPRYWWEREFPGPKGIAWLSAADALQRAAERSGVYDAERLRGRGAWWDDKRLVIHRGNELIVDGKPAPIAGFESHWHYERAASMPLAIGDMATDQESRRLRDLCNMLPFTGPLDGTLLAGWIALAPLCGALKWRPHLWLLGESGTGKSWVMDSIIRPMLEPVAIEVAASTTEPGVRSYLGSDARPVIFDEANPEGGDGDRQAGQNIKNVLFLMRASSQDSGGVIAKGFGVRYRIRSMFVFASAAKAGNSIQDSNRITALEMRKDPGLTQVERQAHFDDVQRAVSGLISAKYAASIQRRMIELLPVIQENAVTFSIAAGNRIGAKRLGDQIGALLAGAYALHKRGLVTQAEAEEFVGRHHWEEQVELAQERDEVACLERILQHRERVQGGSGQVIQTFDRAIAELIETASGGYSPEISITQALGALNRLGIRVQDGRVYFANKHGGLYGILQGTAWSADWRRMLLRIEGAAPTAPMSFLGTKQRAVSLPVSACIAEV